MDPCERDKQSKMIPDIVWSSLVKRPMPVSGVKYDRRSPGEIYMVWEKILISEDAN